MGFRSRLDDFASRFSEHARAASEGFRERQAPPHALQEDYWESVQELFTRDVTGRDLQDLLQREPHDTLRFFTREIDFAALQPQPWYRRYPKAAWKIFLAMAYRLSPARRIVFAAAVPVLLLGWGRAMIARLGRGGLLAMPTAFEWILVAASLVFFLLILELRDKLTLKGDLEVARQIQFGLLPFEPYHKGGVAIATFMRPANTVGGDYFDVIELPEGGLAVVLGDVAGKGMPAALLMALLQGSLRTLLNAGLRGAELCSKLNSHLYTTIPSNRLITLFYGELAEGAGCLRYVNAGHNPPFLLRGDGPAERLAPTAMALGVLSETPFEAMETELLPGDRLVLYTDGITEAFNPREEEYGDARLEAVLERHRRSSEKELVEGLVEDVLSFCDSARPRDDMSLLILSRER